MCAKKRENIQKKVSNWWESTDPWTLPCTLVFSALFSVPYKRRQDTMWKTRLKLDNKVRHNHLAQKFRSICYFGNNMLSKMTATIFDDWSLKYQIGLRIQTKKTCKSNDHSSHYFLWWNYSNIFGWKLKCLQIVIDALFTCAAYKELS